MKQVRRLRVRHFTLDGVDIRFHMSVGGENVKVSIQIEVKEEAGEGECQQRCVPDVRDRRIVNKKVAFVVIEIQHLIRKVPNDKALPAASVVVRRVNAHRAGRDAVLVIGNPGEHRRLDERAVAVVLIEFIGLRVVRLKDVWPTVAVVIKDAHAEGFAGVILNPSDAGDIEKRAIASVSKEFAGLPGVRFGGAIGFVRAIQRAENIGFDAPLHIVRDIEIEVAILIVVKPRTTRAEAGVLNASGFCHVKEGPIALVLKEPVGFKAADVNIRVFVVIVICDSDSHAVERHCQANGFGDIGERAVAVVAIKCHRLPSSCWMPWPIFAVDKEDILPAIQVIVQKGAA